MLLLSLKLTVNYHPTLQFDSCLRSVLASFRFVLFWFGFTELIWFTPISNHRRQLFYLLRLKAQTNTSDARSRATIKKKEKTVLHNCETYLAHLYVIANHYKNRLCILKIFHYNVELCCLNHRWSKITRLAVFSYKEIICQGSTIRIAVLHMAFKMPTSKSSNSLA